MDEDTEARLDEKFEDFVETQSAVAKPVLALLALENFCTSVAGVLLSFHARQLITDAMLMDRLDPSLPITVVTDWEDAVRCPHCTVEMLGGGK